MLQFNSDRKLQSLGPPIIIYLDHGLLLWYIFTYICSRELSWLPKAFIASRNGIRMGTQNGQSYILTINLSALGVYTKVSNEVIKFCAIRDHSPRHLSRQNSEHNCKPNMDPCKTCNAASKQLCDYYSFYGQTVLDFSKGRAITRNGWLPNKHEFRHYWELSYAKWKKQNSLLSKMLFITVAGVLIRYALKQCFYWLCVLSCSS